MKSPAVNFYTSDFLTGTTFMSNKTVGAYIRTLSYQHQLGHLSEEYINKIIYDLDENEKQQFFSKLVKDKKGNYYNERMDNEIFKKQKYSESRANNRKNKITYEKDMNNICKSYDKHMENEIEVVIDNNNVITDIINYMNNVLNTNYKSTTESTKKFIRARLNEGFTLEQFKKVIDKKYNEWGQDKTMSKFLRPETLFGTKFESYLNQQDKNKAITPEWLGKDIESTTDETENKEFKEFIEEFRKE